MERFPEHRKTLRLALVHEESGEGERNYQGWQAGREEGAGFPRITCSDLRGPAQRHNVVDEEQVALLKTEA